MSFHEPIEWNVVLVGAWNRAILTPGGIATRLFKLPDGDPVEVLVPIEGLEPPKVSHDGLTVVASSSRLIVEVKTPGFDSIEKARTIACSALSSLPDTPVTAAGFNIRYRGPSEDTSFPEITRSQIAIFSDCGYEISSNGLLLQLKFGQGVINVKGVIDADGMLILELNFHKDSKQASELIEWLSTDTDVIRSEVERLIEALGLSTQERD